MKINEKHYIAWYVCETAVWSFLVMFPFIHDPSEGIFFYLQFPARLLFARWFVHGYQSIQEHYQKLREQNIHKHIRPILTDPPEIL